MNKYLKNGNGRRLVGTSIGLLAANFIVSIIELWVQLPPNVVASGSLLLAAVINYLVGKYKIGG